MFKKEFILTMILMSFLLFVCTANAAIPKDTLVIGANTGGLATNDPGVTFQTLANAINGNIYARLVKLTIKDKQYIIVPDLAEHWEVAPDGKTLTFHLRKGLVFANGDPLKSDAVVYSFKRVLKIKQTPSWLFTDVIGLTERGYPLLMIIQLK